MNVSRILPLCMNCNRFLEPAEQNPDRMDCKSCGYSIDVNDLLKSVDGFLNGEPQRGRKIESPTAGCDNPNCWVCSLTRELEQSAKEAEEMTMTRKGHEEVSEMPRQPGVPEMLRAAAATFEERNATYGDAYKGYGPVMSALFPQGLWLNEVDDWNRAGVFFMMVGKMMRIAANLATGGHKDSAHDLIVYSAMMEELTNEKAK